MSTTDLIEGLLPQGSIVAVLADEAGHSLAAVVDAGLRVFHDLPFNEREVRPGSVLYLPEAPDMGSWLVDSWRARYDALMPETDAYFKVHRQP